MLDSKAIKKIEDFVGQKPRSLFEVAKFLGVSWRTADRYVDSIIRDFGTIATRTFREGTRGALKIVYFAGAQKAHSSVFQEDMAKQILLFKKKEDFSAFDIYQHIPDSKKDCRIDKAGSEALLNNTEYLSQFEAAKRQVLFFSGNLSFVNLKAKKKSFLQVIDSLVRRKVSIKIICRVDLASLENVSAVLSLNKKHGSEFIEIRHSEQPLRAHIIDGNSVSMKQIFEPTGKARELDSRIYAFYRFWDKEWIDWLSRIFWQEFSNSLDANVRIAELRKFGLQNLKPKSK